MTGMKGQRDVNEIKRAAAKATKPILAEAPFSVSQIRGRLKQRASMSARSTFKRSAT